MNKNNFKRMLEQFFEELETKERLNKKLEDRVQQLERTVEDLKHAVSFLKKKV